jgi:hypothetical protein
VAARVVACDQHGDDASINLIHFVVPQHADVRIELGYDLLRAHGVSPV